MCTHTTFDLGGVVKVEVFKRCFLEKEKLILLKGRTGTSDPSRSEVGQHSLPCTEVKTAWPIQGMVNNSM
jgi:hypothetical protein